MPSNMAFDLNEVFGGNDSTPDISTAAPTPTSQDRGARLVIGGDPTSRTGGAPSTKKEDSRYIDNESPAQNFVTRGFFMYVIMDHREVPEFLASLSSTPFPTEILRVHVTKYKFDGRAPSFAEGESTAAQPSVPGAVKPVDPAADAYVRAMGDPALANVAIAGMMTMYRPPGGTQAAIDAAGKSAPAGTPAPAASGAAPAAPAAAPTAGANPATPAPAEKKAPEKTPEKAPEKPATNGKAEPAPAPDAGKGAAAPPATTPAEPPQAAPAAASGAPAATKSP
jgi:hypothetical protein